MSNDEQPTKTPMTTEQIEQWIMLKGQSGKRWFKIEILDEEVAQEPNMIILMDTLSDFIFNGMKEVGIAESMGNQPPPHLKPVA